MSYFSGVGNTELIARRGYSDISDWKDVTGKIWGGLTGALDFYGDKTRAEGAVRAYETAAQAAQAQAAQAQAAQARSSTPSWLLPAALAGGALVLFTVMRDRR